MADSKTIQLTSEGQTTELPILSGTMGPDVIDIRKLYAEKGLFTFDPGFTSTASCTSTVTPEYCSTAVIRLSSWRKSVIFLRFVIYY